MNRWSSSGEQLSKCAQLDGHYRQIIRYPETIIHFTGAKDRFMADYFTQVLGLRLSGFEQLQADGHPTAH